MFANIGDLKSSVISSEKNLPLIKVNKSRKQILKVSFEPNNKQNCICISALASKNQDQC